MTTTRQSSLSTPKKEEVKTEDSTLSVGKKSSRKTKKEVSSSSTTTDKKTKKKSKEHDKSDSSHAIEATTKTNAPEPVSPSSSKRRRRTRSETDPSKVEPTTTELKEKIDDDDDDDDAKVDSSSSPSSSQAMMIDDETASEVVSPPLEASTTKRRRRRSRSESLVEQQQQESNAAVVGVDVAEHESKTDKETKSIQDDEKIVDSSQASKATMTSHERLSLSPASTTKSRTESHSESEVHPPPLPPAAPVEATTAVDPTELNEDASSRTKEKTIDSKSQTIKTALPEPASPSLSSTTKRRHRSRSETKEHTQSVEKPVAAQPSVDDSPVKTPASSKKNKKEKKSKIEKDSIITGKEKDVPSTTPKKPKRSSSKDKTKKTSAPTDDDDVDVPMANEAAPLQSPQQHSTSNTAHSRTPMSVDKTSPPQSGSKLDDTTMATEMELEATETLFGQDDNDIDSKALPENSTPPSKLPPTMDVMVHRVRYVQFLPSPILCMAVTPTNNNESPPRDHEHEQQLLALSRQNGSVEVRGVDEKFRVLTSVAGLREKTVDCLAWICGKKSTSNQKILITTATTTTSSSSSLETTQPRNHTALIGASNDGTLFCVQFAHGRFASVTPSGGGAVFCLQSLCATHDCARNGGCRHLVAAGCEDGAVRIFQLSYNDYDVRNDKILSDPPRLHLVSTIPTAGAAVLSLAWRRFSSPGGAAGSTIVFAGVADGTIRRYDCHEAMFQSMSPDGSDIGVGGSGGHWKSSHRMTVECYGRSDPTRVWKLLLLSDGTVVSGDSLGHVQFWDGQTGTLSQGFDQNDSKADVLDMAVSSDETKVFACGVDSRVVCIERTAFARFQQKWILSHAQRPHTHDVKALAICRRHDRFGASPVNASLSSSSSTTTTSVPTTASSIDVDDVLCTGGIDTKMCTYLVKKFQKARPRNLYPWPRESLISFATETRILLMRRETQVDLYQLSATPEKPFDTVVIPSENALVGSIEIKSLGNLVCSDISKSGRLVAISDHATLLIFQIEYLNNGEGTMIADPKRVSLPKSLRIPCLAVKFVSNNKLVAATTNGVLQVIEFSEEDDEAVQPRLLQSLRVMQDSFFPVGDICVSANQQWIATVSNGGVAAGTIQVFRRTDGKDSYQYWWSIPALDAPSSAARFINDQANAKTTTMLAVACYNFALYVFDVQNKTLSPWSEANGFPMSHTLAKDLVHRNDVPVRITYNPATPQKVLLGSFGAFVLINLENKLPSTCCTFPERHFRRSMRKRQRTMSFDALEHQPKEEEEVEEKEEQAVCSVEDSKNCTICLRYNSMLHLDFIANHEMLVVEQPWLEVVASFPAPMERQLYGNP